MIGYKVITENMESLGLRKNPNILTYPINRWYRLSSKQLKKGSDDWGGIWVAKTLSGAKTLKKYMKEKYDKNVKIYKSLLGGILYMNSYRIKTNAIKLIEEINV